MTSANDMKIFIDLSESPLKIRKVAGYRSLISFLVSKLLRCKDLKNSRMTSCDRHLIVNNP